MHSNIWRWRLEIAGPAHEELRAPPPPFLPSHVSHRRKGPGAHSPWCPMCLRQAACVGPASKCAQTSSWVCRQSCWLLGMQARQAVGQSNRPGSLSDMGRLLASHTGQPHRPGRLLANHTGQSHTPALSRQASFWAAGPAVGQEGHSCRGGGTGKTTGLLLGTCWPSYRGPGPRDN